MRNKILIASNLPDDKTELEPCRFNDILDALKEVHHLKGVLYGNYVSSNVDEKDSVAFTAVYLQIKNKQRRIQNIITFMQKDIVDDDIKQALLDSLLDLSVYAAMGVDMWFERFGDG